MASERSILDTARAHRLEGRTDEALRLAIPLLEADSGQLGAALFLSRVLINDGKKSIAADVATRLVDAFARRGDLPQALVAAKVADDAGEDADACYTKLANLYGADSDRLADVAPAPPPLPTEVEVSSALKKLSGKELLSGAESALRGFFEIEDDHDPAAPLPALPLFSELESDKLAPLLAAYTVRDVKPEEALVTEGEEGKEAFVVANGRLRVLRGGEGEEPILLAALGPGALFGEMALVSQAPRAASVIADEVSTVLSISRKKLESLAKTTPEIGQQLAGFCRGRMIANLMRHSAILGSVESDDRQSLFDRFNTRHLAEGETLVDEGDEGTGLFLLASGTVEVVGNDADGDTLRIAELGPGDVVGEISLVLRRPANATVRATTPTVALFLGRDAFQDAIREHPTLLGELYETATAREEETRSVVAQEAMDIGEAVLL